MDDISAIATMRMDDEPMPSVEDAPERDRSRCEVCGEVSATLYASYCYPAYACCACDGERRGLTGNERDVEEFFS